MTTLYTALRQEIIATDQLLHWFTFAFLLFLAAGLVICEIRRSVLAVILPMMSVMWAASVVRFDVLIHRAGAYLKTIETPLVQGDGVAGWEQWKALHRPGFALIAASDMIVFIVAIAITVLILRGPTRDYFNHQRWRGITLYSCAIIIAMIGLLAIVGMIPKMISE